MATTELTLPTHWVYSQVRLTQSCHVTPEHAFMVVPAQRPHPRSVHGRQLGLGMPTPRQHPAET
jgi:hypothetical protein